jgi:prophage regulatory protein
MELKQKFAHSRIKVHDAADQFNRENSMRLISYDDLKPAKGIRYSRTQLWRLERDGHFPKRIRIGVKHYAWIEDEVDRFIVEKIRARDEAAA